MGGSRTPDTTTTTTELPEWARGHAQDLLTRGSALSSQNMPVYKGPRTADLNGMQTQGMQMIADRAKAGSAVVNAGNANVMDTLNGKFLSENNPYLGAAIDRASQDVTRNYHGAVNSNDALMARSGAFGGSAWQQAQEGEAVPKDLAALKPGDLLTFGKGKRISHIGIYVGNGRMVHASTSKRSVIETELTSRNPLVRQWQGVRRIVADSRADFRDSLLAIADTVR